MLAAGFYAGPLTAVTAMGAAELDTAPNECANCNSACMSGTQLATPKNLLSILAGQPRFLCVVPSDPCAMALMQVEELTSTVNAAEKLKAAHKEAKVGRLQRCLFMQHTGV